MKIYSKPTLQILSASIDSFIAASLVNGGSNDDYQAPKTAEGKARRNNWGNLWEEEE